MTRLSTVIIFIFVSCLSVVNAQNEDSFTDKRDGNTYKTTKIGDQVWMSDNLSFKAGSYCWPYGDNELNVKNHGYLYTFEVANKVCPKGWKLPEKSDFKILLKNYGGEEGLETNYSELLSNDNSIFYVDFAGCRELAGTYDFLGNYAAFWSSTSNSDTDAWNLYLLKSTKNAGLYFGDKNLGFSVRCLKE